MKIRGIRGTSPPAFAFAVRGTFRQTWGMRNHEWFDHDEDAGERRYFRAGKFGKKWSVITTLKSAPDWDSLDPVPLPVLEALRLLLENKYARRRVPWADVVAMRPRASAPGRSVRIIWFGGKARTLIRVFQRVQNGFVRIASRFAGESRLQHTSLGLSTDFRPSCNLRGH